MLTQLTKAFALLTVVSSSIVAVGCAAPAPTAEAEGETGSYLLSGPVLSAAQVAGYVRSAGFPEAMVGKMVCTAKYESSFYQKASNGSHYGLFQISKQHLGTTSGCVSSVNGIYDPANNAKCALGVYKAQGLGAWEAYTSHKSTCDRYKAPASASSTASSTSTSTSGSSTSDTSTTVPVPVPRPSDSDLGLGDSGDTDDTSDGTDTSSTDLSGGGCYSATLQSMTDELACVQSNASNGYGVWFQCYEGQWYRGGDSASGPYGTCSSAQAL